MRTVTKVFNNNIVHAVDGDGEDVILVGAGVGFRASRGDSVNEDRVEREFHPTGLVPSGAFRVLLDLPYPAIRAISIAADHIARVHGTRLTPAAEVGLADHIAQAISRLEEGLPIYNSMLWETKAAYPQEFAIALEVLSIVHRELGRKLPLDEAGFVTLHLVNAGVVRAPEQGITLSAALRDVIGIVADDLGITVDGSSAAGVRFITHLKFVIKRVTRNQAYNDAFDAFFRTLREQHPPVYRCASHIATYLDNSFDAAVTEAERTIARPAPASYAVRNGSTELGAMPAKVSVKIRPMVTAGLANEVELVNQYAAPM
ncbi:MAG: PRD domain-containing protein [Tessaracoccus sp.]|nr:PRD domain-containing protein [Tessaracoccus sp.]